jgi:hypothetical protein
MLVMTSGKRLHVTLAQEKTALPKLVSKELPDALLARLSGRQVDRYLDQVVLIHTVDKDGWPHPAVLSYFEIAAKNATLIHLATYNDSQTTGNMRRTGKVTLSIYDERIAYSIKCNVQEARHEMQSERMNSLLEATVVQVLSDEASQEREPGAHIASGVTFTNPKLALERSWREAVLRELME